MLLLTGCKKQIQEISSPSVIMKEAITEDKHYRLYTDGEYIYLEDVMNNTTEKLRKRNASIKEQLILPTIDAKTSLPDTNLFEHQKEVTPFTYDATLELSATYLKALEQSGWTTYAEFSNYLFIDKYLAKDNANMRIIILKDKIKIFEDMTDEVADPLSYINGDTTATNK